MKTIIISNEQANKRIDKVIKESFVHMPVSAMYKAFRKKDIKVNGAWVKEDFTVSPGDMVDIYITDKILKGAPLAEDRISDKEFEIAYEDANILIVDKKQGVPVHPDREQSTNTLIDQVRTYLDKKGEYHPDDSNPFPPSLCHRIDRNTGGLVMIARNQESLRIILNMMKQKGIKKYYQCLVKGKMEKPFDELKAYLLKDENKSKVFISNNYVNGSVEITTRYRVLSYEDDISRLEVELITGRTHQIRAHLAYIGHPIVGDGKYGSNAYNRSLGAKYQALWAYKIVFGSMSTGALAYLNGKTIEVVPNFKLGGSTK